MKIDENNKFIQRSDEKVIKAERGFAPFLIIAPLLFGSWLIYSWWTMGFAQGIPDFDIELLLGLIILIGNIAFDIPFIKSLKKRKEENEKKNSWQP
jgi:hypothetical protein